MVGRSIHWQKCQSAASLRRLGIVGRAPIPEEIERIDPDRAVSSRLGRADFLSSRKDTAPTIMTACE